MTLIRKIYTWQVLGNLSGVNYLCRGFYFVNDHISQIKTL
jgi:hypothetical protein